MLKFLSCWILALACSSAPISVEDVIGSYELNKGSARDEVEVLTNGRYIHTYALDSGTWSLREHDGTRLLFEGFRSWSRGARYPHQSTERPPAALWPALVERSVLGEVRLIVDIDQDWAYVRKK